MNANLKDLSGATLKVVGATFEIEDFGFSLLPIDLTEDTGVGSTCTHIAGDHCYFIVDHYGENGHILQCFILVVS